MFQLLKGRELVWGWLSDQWQPEGWCLIVFLETIMTYTGERNGLWSRTVRTMRCGCVMMFGQTMVNLIIETYCLWPDNWKIEQKEWEPVIRWTAAFFPSYYDYAF